MRQEPSEAGLTVWQAAARASRACQGRINVSRTMGGKSIMGGRLKVPANWKSSQNSLQGDESTSHMNRSSENLRRPLIPHHEPTEGLQPAVAPLDNPPALIPPHLAPP